MEELMLKIDNVSKMYKLGQVGGTTLKEELQRKRAKLLHQEDPTKKIGTKEYNMGETFMALNGVSFEVKKGERIGIIGHNGAGKSTLLKLISRVTAPSTGTISLNGRVASMLEVGTGFHPELTGRENIYMNGAILGMTKKEIDDKIEDIIEFSEVRRFIDTPVKRYSSGMYVKLAFSVAAHLSSEIMIMDEVLAVGDMAFQTKCLKKMRDVSASEGRTILYVSHNMDTIRQLCERVIVLNQGKIVFDGDTNEGISNYLNKRKSNHKDHYNLLEYTHEVFTNSCCSMTELNIKNTSLCNGEKVYFDLSIESSAHIKCVVLRILLINEIGQAVGVAYSEEFGLNIGHNTVSMCLDTSIFIEGVFNCASFLLIEYSNGLQKKHDAVFNLMDFSIDERKYFYGVNWQKNSWGSLKLKCSAKNLDIGIPTLLESE